MPRGRGRGGGGGGGRVGHGGRSSGRGRGAQADGLPSGGRGRGGGKAIIPEKSRLELIKKMEAFKESDEEVLMLPNLNNIERAWVHSAVAKMCLRSKSHGKGENRVLHITRIVARGQVSALRVDAAAAADAVGRLAEVASGDVTVANGVARASGGSGGGKGKGKGRGKGGGKGKGGGGGGKGRRDEWRGDRWPAAGPPPAGVALRPPPDVKNRESLPSRLVRSDVLSAIAGNQVLVLTGETGCGKTTQVPQFCLEEALGHSPASPCRIVCTQPRRIAAISVAHRVAHETGTQIGSTVGYGVRLESKRSDDTQILFCTTGLFLKMLVSNPKLEGLTHVILDEVHERDRYTDFLLIMLRQLLPSRPDLRLVLMSATLEVDTFKSYFPGAGEIHVTGRTFPVERMFLGEALRAVGFQGRGGGGGGGGGGDGGGGRGGGAAAAFGAAVAASAPAAAARGGASPSQSGFNAKQLEARLDRAWHSDRAKAAAAVDEILTAAEELAETGEIVPGGVDVDHPHPKTGVTLLMLAAAKGCVPQCKRLLAVGANPDARAANGWQASDFARHFRAAEAAELLAEADPDAELCAQYQAQFDDSEVDVDLVASLVEHICRHERPGGVLVFMPGMDDINRATSAIESLVRPSPVRVFPLHSSCTQQEQRAIFKSMPPGTRKVVISTNIAESSITIDDVVFVVDSGKHKEMAYDTASGVHTLLPQWVPVSSLRQRAGRAGRTSPGKCWHLLTRARAAALPQSQAPEMLRTPLSEICLSASLLCAEFGETVEGFLLQAPSPPSQRSIGHALDTLVKVGAMDDDHEVTEFGRVLSRISLDPRLAKMALLGCCLGCLSPVLIVAAAADNRDPFTLPMNPALKARAREAHSALGKGDTGWASLLLRVFNRWVLSGDKRRFCDQNFIRPEALRMIQNIVSQIEGQLRSIRLVGPDARTHLFSMDEANRNAGDMGLIECALAGGLYPNVAVPIAGSKKRLETYAGVRATTQNLPPSDRWVVYEKAARGQGRSVNLQNATPVSAIAVLCLAGQDLATDAGGGGADEEEEEEEEEEDVWDGDPTDAEADRATLTLDDWARVRLDASAAHSVLLLREVWRRRFDEHVLGPRDKRRPAMEQFDDFIVALKGVLAAERRRRR